MVERERGEEENGVQDASSFTHTRKKILQIKIYNGTRRETEKRNEKEFNKNNKQCKRIKFITKHIYRLLFHSPRLLLDFNW